MFWGQDESEGRVRDKERDRQGVTASALTGVAPSSSSAPSTGEAGPARARSLPFTLITHHAFQRSGH